MERGGRASAFNAGGGTVMPNNSPPASPPLYLISPTGRTCNSLDDVVVFTVTLHVDQTKIPAFLKELATNRFISVRKMELHRVDNNAMLEQGYVYRSAPVAEIVLDCETLQMREWTAKLMPKTIKDMLLGPGVEYSFQLQSAGEKKQGG